MLNQILTVLKAKNLYRGWSTAEVNAFKEECQEEGSIAKFCRGNLLPDPPSYPPHIFPTDPESVPDILGLVLKTYEGYVVSATLRDFEKKHPARNREELQRQIIAAIKRVYKKLLKEMGITLRRGWLTGIDRYLDLTEKALQGNVLPGTERGRIGSDSTGILEVHLYLGREEPPQEIGGTLYFCLQLSSSKKRIEQMAAISQFALDVCADLRCSMTLPDVTAVCAKELLAILKTNNLL